MRAVHQLVPVFTPGDAISGAVRLTRTMLRQLGFRSEIYAEAIDPAMKSHARPAHELPSAVRAHDCVIYHLSLESPLATLWQNLEVTRALVYHNMTPPEYFRAVSARVTFDLETGRRHLPDVVAAADFCIADSTFNQRDLREAGATECVVIPPPVDIARLTPTPTTPSQPPTLLFVGRLAPNKRQDFLISVIAVLRQAVDLDARLVLAGGGTDANDYVTALQWRARTLEVGDAVVIPSTRMTDAALRDLYRTASVFVCASEHEGFCMPLMEAMAFDLPVVAHAAGAVPETLGDAGILLDDADPLLWAETIAEVISNTALRGHLAALGRARLLDFSPASIETKLGDALAKAGVTASS
jgi:glycosyltransferase involved in cell wall biosynthesis